LIAPRPGGIVHARTNGSIRIGALGDLHTTLSPESRRQVQSTLAAASAACDVLLLAGDLTDHGSLEEAEALAQDLRSNVNVPVAVVLGNHDFESGQEREVARVLRDAGAHVLDGDAWEVHGVGIAGAKGFAGGFGRGALGPWGESTIKLFVREAVEEALKLESALARLRTSHRIALLHYSPIRETVEGEPLEIYPYLGSSRLAEPLDRYRVSAVFHGHAHRGSPSGSTALGAPVFNVAVQVLRRAHPDQPPVKIVEVQPSAALGGGGSGEGAAAEADGVASASGTAAAAAAASGRETSTS
jgi:Icc-related predicted phosphoesterase